MKEKNTIKKLEKKIKELGEINYKRVLDIFNEVGSDKVFNYPMHFKLYQMAEIDYLAENGTIDGALSEILQRLDSGFSACDPYLMIMDNGRITSVQRVENMFTARDLAVAIDKQEKAGETDGWDETWSLIREIAAEDHCICIDNREGAELTSRQIDDLREAFREITAEDTYTSNQKKDSEGPK